NGLDHGVQIGISADLYVDVVHPQPASTPGYLSCSFFRDGFVEWELELVAAFAASGSRLFSVLDDLERLGALCSYRPSAYALMPCTSWPLIGVHRGAPGTAGTCGISGPPSLSRRALESITP